jgi:hypothetical protein
MDIDDAALMYAGWGEGMLYEQQIARKMTMILGDVVNKSMGGKGVMKHAKKIWPLPGDEWKVKSSQLELLKTFKELDLKKGLAAIKSNKPKINIESKEPPLVKNNKKGVKNGKR